jgi:hypothetical protein
MRIALYLSYIMPASLDEESICCDAATTKNSHRSLVRLDQVKVSFAQKINARSKPPLENKYTTEYHQIKRRQSSSCNLRRK